MCGCTDRFRTLFLAHIRDSVAMHREKNPGDQTGHHWGSSLLYARSKFRYLVTRTERMAKPLIIMGGRLC